MRTGKPLLVNRASPIERPETGSRPTSRPRVASVVYVEKGSPTAVWLGVPLRVRGEIIGVMAVQDYEQRAGVRSEEQQILGFVAEQTALAIERKRAEQALRESEEKFRALFEASSQGVMLHDEEQFLDVNSAAVRLMGHGRAEEILGRHPRDFAPPFQPDGEPSDAVAQRHIAECLERGAARFEWTIVTPSGGAVQLEVDPHPHSDGRAAHHPGGRERHRPPQAGRGRAPRRPWRGKRNSASCAATSCRSSPHEFRTPLGIIMSSAEILRDYLDQLAPRRAPGTPRLHPGQHAADGRADGGGAAARPL